MSNIPPISGPSPGNDDLRPPPLNGAFDPATQATLTRSAVIASQIGHQLQATLRPGPQDAQTYALHSGIQSLFAGVMRLAASPHILPDGLAELSFHLQRLSQAGSHPPAIAAQARVIERALDRAAFSPGDFDLGTLLALSHCHDFAQRLRDATLSALKQGRAAITPIARQTLDLARELAGPSQRFRGTDPQAQLVLQGMAATLHAVAARITADQTRGDLGLSLYRLLATVEEAAAQRGVFTRMPLAMTGAQIGEELQWFGLQAVRHPRLFADMHLCLLSLDADAEALATVGQNQSARFNRLLDADGTV